MRPIDLTWPGGEHSFYLDIGRLRAIQAQCKAGPGFIHTRLTTGVMELDDIISPIRHGLEGGGMPKDEARDLIAKMVDEVPLSELQITAAALMGIVMYGVDYEGEDEDGVGESDGEVSQTDQNSPTDESALVTSTGSDKPAD